MRLCCWFVVGLARLWLINTSEEGKVDWCECASDAFDLRSGDPGGERRERPRPVSHAEGGPTGPTSTDGCHRPSVEGAIPSMRE